jgi:tRNA G10  N-methylase Trm11
MLPPKLAQIIINLSIGISTKKQRLRILDPFCGTGVLLQEAMLMDLDIYGTDLEPRMIQYSIGNLSWLDEKYPEVGDYRRVEVGDATNFKWYEPEKITNVACETYLGQPLTALPNSEHLSKIIYEVNLLHHKFLENIGSQVAPRTRFCLAIPTWRGKREFLHLPMLDYLHDLGYTRMRFKHVNDKDLIYHRENQVVGRELLVLEKR